MTGDCHVRFCERPKVQALRPTHPLPGLVSLRVQCGDYRLVKSNRKAGMNRNPQTGEAIKIPAKTVVKFRVAKAAEDSIIPKK